MSLLSWILVILAGVLIWRFLASRGDMVDSRNGTPTREKLTDKREDVEFAEEPSVTAEACDRGKTFHVVNGHVGDTCESVTTGTTTTSTTTEATSIGLAEASAASTATGTMAMTSMSLPIQMEVDEKYAAEYSQELTSTSASQQGSSNNSNQTVETKDNGVSLKKGASLAEGIQVWYYGLLRNDGADGVLVHCGKDGWQDIKDVWMDRQDDGSFKATLHEDASKEVNICFKDTADHYDDNSGWNWTVK